MAGGGSQDPAFRDRMARIEVLIDRIKEAADVELREACLEVVRLVMELHGAGLERMMKIVASVDGPGRTITEGFTRDELISSLLLLYGLHPADLETRVRQALEKVRPYLHSHGGDVELAGIASGTVQLRLQGSCKGCPSSSITLRLAVEEAVYEAAPEVTAVVAEGSAAAMSTVDSS
jgi:Fe-S cluster biogenesis protein NfuA